MSGCEFLCRVLLFEHDPPEYQVWVHELYPLGDVAKRESDEWVKCHLGDLGNDGFRDHLGLDKDGNWQVLFKGRLRGYWVHYPESEYDEDMYVVSIDAKEMIPESYLKLLEESNAATQTDQTETRDVSDG